MSLNIHGKRYVIETSRERVPVTDPKLDHKITDAIDRHKLKENFGLMHDNNGFWELVFAKESGISLPDVIHQHYKAHSRFLFVEQISDDEHVAVFSRDGSIDATHSIKGKSDGFFWGAITEEISTYKLFISGKIPEELEGFIDDETDIQHVDSSIMLSLPTSDFMLENTESAFSKHKISKEVYFMVLAAIAIIVLGVMVFMGSREDEEIIVDNFASYRSHFSQPSATSVLIESKNIIESIQSINGWKFSKCVYQNTILECEYTPKVTGLVSSLKERLDALDKDYDLKLIKENAVVTFALKTLENSRPYLITSLEDATLKLRKNIILEQASNSVAIEETIKATFWSNRIMTTTKDGVGLYNLLQIAQCASRLPVTISKFSVADNQGTYNINIKLMIIGDHNE